MSGTWVRAAGAAIVLPVARGLQGRHEFFPARTGIGAPIRDAWVESPQRGRWASPALGRFASPQGDGINGPAAIQ